MASTDGGNRSLVEALAAALPADSHANTGTRPDARAFSGRVRYIHTPAKPCDPLFSPPPGHEPDKTRLSSHFLSVSVDAQHTPGSSTGIIKPSDTHEEDVLGIGIEVFIYTTRHLTTIFVSKADTSGYIPSRPPSKTKTICFTFIQWLVDRERQRHPNRKVVVSLFARAQAQYLFPGSAEHSGKHVLDDRQLIEWWAKVLDSVLDLASNDEERPDINGYVTIPGYDASELRSYLPRSQHSHGRSWKTGHPLTELAETRGVSAAAPPRSLLPRFPDDPKARFMQDLDDEVGLSEDAPVTVSPSKRKSGRWNNVRDLDRFWEAMEFRQECSSGRVVGFLWVVISSKSTANGNGKLDAESGASQESSQGPLSSEPLPHRDTTPTPSQTTSPKKRARKPLTGPIIPRQPRLKGGSSSLTATATSTDLHGMLNSIRGDGLCMSQEGYEKAMQMLLHLDFANLEVAARSTRKWVAEVASICGLAGDWAVEVVGRAEVVGEAKGLRDVGRGNGNWIVNDLGGMVRKKRKAADEVGRLADEPMAAETPAVNVLGAGAIRKKPKPPVA